jgi:glycine/D-amino acid oxidase-like deaminating enzyme
MAYRADITIIGAGVIGLGIAAQVLSPGFAKSENVSSRK